jgi:hypothetical protein
MEAFDLARERDEQGRISSLVSVAKRMIAFKIAGFSQFS